jgi:hypothetical protein
MQRKQRSRYTELIERISWCFAHGKRDEAIALMAQLEQKK